MIEEKKRGPKLDWEVTPAVIDKIKEMSGLMTQEQMYHYFGIGKDTWYDRKAKNAEMADAIKSGESRKILEVASKLFDEIKAGNVTAMIFYLKTKARWAEHAKLQVSEPVKKELPKSLGNDPIQASRTYQEVISK